MKQVLGKKQTSSDSAWFHAIKHIEEYITKDEVESYAETAIQRIRDFTSGKNAAYGWSGGKDSIVLADLCEAAGIHRGFMAYSNLEYPAFMNWCKKNKPSGVEAIHVDLDLDWLAKHPEFIFTTDPVVVERWIKMDQRRPFTKMFFENHLDVLLVGHRVIDGNNCGKDGVIRKRSGEVRYTPIYDWPHEALLGYIHYKGLELPPIYGWKDGFMNGTHPWPKRARCATLEQGYAEVYEIDPSIVITAAEKIPSAAAFLEHLKEVNTSDTE